MLKLKTKSATYDVVKNEDGTLTITLGKSPVRNTGQMIMSMGGVDALLARCKEYTEEEWQAKKAADKAARTAQVRAGERMAEKYAAQHEDEDNAIFGGDKIAECTPDNIRQLLIHLNGQNWGLWKLPKMNVDYKCSQHDCDGKPATTIILAEPVSCDGRMTSRFCIGAPAKYLNDYYKFRY